MTFTFTYPFTAGVVGAPQMTSQPVSSIFLSPLAFGTCRTPGLSIPCCCLPTSFSVCLVFFLLSLCLARWFWPNQPSFKITWLSVCIFSSLLANQLLAKTTPSFKTKQNHHHFDGILSPNHDAICPPLPFSVQHATGVIHYTVN